MVHFHHLSVALQTVKLKYTYPITLTREDRRPCLVHQRVKFRPALASIGRLYEYHIIALSTPEDVNERLVNLNGSVLDFIGVYRLH